MRRLGILICILWGAGFAWPGQPVAQTQDSAPETRLLRFPDCHETFVAFVYAGDIWRAPIEGGTARRLTSHEGFELVPKISPDGSQIAFTAEYSGTRQVYVMPSNGGTPKQLTYYNDVGVLPNRGGFDNWIQDWTPDGKILVRMNRTPMSPRYGRYFLVDPNGGLETPLDLPHGGSASLSPDGNTLAYTPYDREFRTWKRARGGRAQDLWTYDLKAHKSTQLTTFTGTDNFPMWVEDDTIYFTSDREYTLNLFRYTPSTKQIAKVTQFDDYDVLWPGFGPKNIVFLNGGYLYTYDLADGNTKRLSISIESELPYTLPYFKDVSDDVRAGSISPSGARAVLEARGDLFSVPASDGAIRNLTLTQGVRERDPAWSPDGKHIAYLSDESGEYQLYVRSQDGREAARRVGDIGANWPSQPVWSPDSSKLVFFDGAMRLRMLDVASGRLTEVDTGSAQGDLNGIKWSPDSKWLAYDKTRDARLSGISLYSLEQSKVFDLGDGLTTDVSPAFSHDGRTLFFLSNRDYQINFSDFEFNYVYDRSTRVYAVALDASEPALFAPKSDEEAGNTDEDGDSEDSDEKGDKEDKPAFKLDIPGIPARTIALPGLPAGDYSQVTATEGAVYYVRSDDDGNALYRFDLEEREEAKVMDGVGGYEISADGKKLLYTSRGQFGIADAKAGAEGEPLDLSTMSMKIDPRREWQQIFDETWRVGRDYFYDSNMHGLDWEAMRTRYGQLVPHVAHRTDLDFILGELAGELMAGHAYVIGGDHPRVERIEGGMLGCEFEAHSSGYFRFAKIFPGENWDAAYRSPLTEPGVDVDEGDYLLAIDGVELKTTDNPYRLLEGKGNATVTITVSSKPSSSDSRDVMVRPVTSELNLRYLDWVRTRMAMTEKLSGGRVGYMHLPNTAIAGNRMLQKLWYSQSQKEALIVDDRYNGGGFIPDRMIEYLTRRTWSYWDRRDRMTMRTPGFAHDGPKAMLINGYAASGGDALPYYFRLNRLGKLIGTRTWGGLIGISGNPTGVDGGGILYPVFRFYDTQGNWAVENEGVAPDIEVLDLPEELRQGRDPSLMRAVDELLKELKERPWTHPKPPTPPNLVEELK